MQLEPQFSCEESPCIAASRRCLVVTFAVSQNLQEADEDQAHLHRVVFGVPDLELKLYFAIFVAAKKRREQRTDVQIALSYKESNIQKIKEEARRHTLMPHDAKGRMLCCPQHL